LTKISRVDHSKQKKIHFNIKCKWTSLSQWEITTNKKIVRRNEKIKSIGNDRFRWYDGRSLLILERRRKKTIYDQSLSFVFEMIWSRSRWHLSYSKWKSSSSSSLTRVIEIHSSYSLTLKQQHLWMNKLPSIFYHSYSNLLFYRSLSLACFTSSFFFSFTFFISNLFKHFSIFIFSLFLTKKTWRLSRIDVDIQQQTTTTTIIILIN